MGGRDHARKRYMRAAGALQMGWALFALLFGGTLVRWFIREDGPSMVIFPTGLGVFVGAFGVLSWMAAPAAPGPALRAVLIGLSGYLLCSVLTDAWWALNGMLTAWIWLSLTMRAAVAAGYLFFVRGSGG